MKKQIIVPSLLGVGVLVAGLLAFNTMQPSSVSAAELVETAVKRTQQMSPEEIASATSLYNEDLAKRLNEAKQDDDLRVLPADEYDSWATTPSSATVQLTSRDDQSVETYLTYTDAKGERIIIALDATEQPVYIMNFDAKHAAEPANAASGNSVSPTGPARQ